MTQDYTDMLNGMLDGYNRAMGVRFVKVTELEVVAELDIEAHHKQPYGIVHGGVYTGLVETVASVGAGVRAIQEGRSVVGLENHTSFLRAVRGGRVRATATPLTRGRRTHVWQVMITDGDGHAVASGTMRLLMLDKDAQLAGETVAMKAR